MIKDKNKLQIIYKIVAVILMIQTWIAPIFFFMVMFAIGEEYMGATDIPFEYIGQEPFNFQESKNVEISSSIYGGTGYNFWAYIADDEDEYRMNYGECGMSNDIYEQVDFDDYIMVMSVNRPLTAIRIMKIYPVWEDSVPYSYPQFVFGRKEEKNMIYYYKVYRIETKYQRQGQEIVSRLKLYAESYWERKSGKYPKPMPTIEPWGPFKKWRWAFDMFNTIS